MQAFSQAVVISVVHDETPADYDTLTLWDPPIDSTKQQNIRIYQNEQSTMGLCVPSDLHAGREGCASTTQCKNHLFGQPRPLHPVTQAPTNT
jgi:hypothetical protein